MKNNSMAEVKLFGTVPSPFSRRVEMALKMKGVEYEFIEEDLDDKSALLLKYNPVHQKIPVLLHNGKSISESLVILEYIDETWEGPALLPTDPHERAMARFWAKFLDDKCWPEIRKACYSKGEEQEIAKEELTQLMKLLDQELKGKKFFVGDKFGMADIAANVLAYWFGLITELVGLKDTDKERHPNLCEWVEDYMNYSIVKENFPPKDKFMERYRARIQAMSASK